MLVEEKKYAQLLAKGPEEEPGFTEDLDAPDEDEDDEDDDEDELEEEEEEGDETESAWES